MRYNMLNVTFKSQYPNLENFIQIYAGAFLKWKRKTTQRNFSVMTYSASLDEYKGDISIPLYP